MKYWFSNIMRQLEREPEAPVNVRLTWPNGQTVPVETVHGGVENGEHMWIVAYPLAAPTVQHPNELAGTQIDFDAMPDHSHVVIRAVGKNYHLIIKTLGTIEQ